MRHDANREGAGPMSDRKLDFPALYMKATYDCAQLKVQCDDLTKEISRLRDENETLRRDVKTAVMGDSAELQDVKRENEKLKAILIELADEYEQFAYEGAEIALLKEARAAAAALRESDNGDI